MKILAPLHILILISLVSACSSRHIDVSQAQTMQQVAQTQYTQHVTRREIHTGAVDYDQVTRSASDEIEQLFPTLPNPTLVMYVYPHIVDHMPVPGYSTAFPLYERVEFAEPR